MKFEKEIGKIPKEGFIKLSYQSTTSLSDSQKTALIRKGNELFNTGNVEQAKRIFLTTRYADGIVRMGDYYYQKRDLYEAIRMYWIAPAPEKKAMIVEMMASTVHRWLQEEGGVQR